MFPLSHSENQEGVCGLLLSCPSMLSGYSLEDSFPILLELAESGREKVADVAKEYLSSVAFGREFKDVEDAKTWYKQYQE